MQRNFSDGAAMHSASSTGTGLNDFASPAEPPQDAVSFLLQQHQDALRGKSRRAQVMQARGTMSMPTSPLLNAGLSLWEDQPQTAAHLEHHKPIPAIPAARLFDDDPFKASPTYHNQPYPSSLFGEEQEQEYSNQSNGDGSTPNGHASSQLPHLPAFTSPLYGQALHTEPSRSMYQAGAHDLMHDHDSDHYYDTNEDGPVRKKRAQVRIACTHCQKACKKCSNTRPCERCVKYGLEDCVDSTRKPRKTGIKRGPYKRRMSKYAGPFGGTPAPPAQLYNGPAALEGRAGAHTLPPPLPRQPHHSGRAVPSTVHVSNGGHYGLTGDQRPGLSLARCAPSYETTRPAPSGIPPPRASTITDAFSAALNGPRWINGQRVDTGGQPLPNPATAYGKNGLPSTLMPETPKVPFPLSLRANGIEDPFSRAVSPIRQMRFPPLPQQYQEQPATPANARQDTKVSEPWNESPHLPAAPTPDTTGQSNSHSLFALLQDFSSITPEASEPRPKQEIITVPNTPMTTGSPFDLAPTAGSMPSMASHIISGAVHKYGQDAHAYSAPTSPQALGGGQTWPAPPQIRAASVDRLTKPTSASSNGFATYNTPSLDEALRASAEARSHIASPVPRPFRSGPDEAVMLFSPPGMGMPIAGLVSAD